MTPPIPIEIRLDGGVTIRGHEFAASGPPVVFLHEPGGDLDSWGNYTAWFAGKGFKVLALDLPGHGLSDGDEDDWASPLKATVAEIGTQWGPIGLVGVGAGCTPLLEIGADDGVPVQTLLSPAEVDEQALRDAAGAMRLLMCGPADVEVHTATKAAYDGLRGERLMITGGGADQGTDLVVGHTHLGEELVMWFRRYLTAYHLAWIKQITTSAKE